MLTDSLKLYERDFMASCRRSNTNVNGSDGHGEHPWSGSWKEHSQEETQECGRVDEGIFSPSLSPPSPCNTDINDTKGAASIDVVICMPKEPSCSNKMIKKGQEACVRLIQVNARAALKLLQTILT